VFLLKTGFQKNQRSLSIWQTAPVCKNNYKGNHIHYIGLGLFIFLRPTSPFGRKNDQE